ncbi:trehalose-6-phosphate synthase [candidate division WOR_3 bacterium SM23_42]|uniref:Alpha,alpha-trehalose-phosphate synthase n=1 Tax=candidate division WOR_3 bacterium SM23_42 TaxID=1703779 RepID=A0A0S8FVX3_UNCW3|nr:MAG: trehalose-6-phosphate synthase [candidate division WOR_3 bacterium SM23_42]
MKRILVISNRLPVTVTKRENNIRFNPSAGGLATGLSSLAKTYHNIWIGWPGIAVERIRDEKNRIKRKLMQDNCHPVYLKQYDLENYYYGFCNRTIWPLFHYFTQYSLYNRRNWDSYVKVNQIFCNEILKIAEPDDKIWIHDYHLMLLPQLLREKLTAASIGFFLHIPFPSSEVFRILPPRKEIARGILGADLIGFHTYDYAHHFIQTVRRLLGYEQSRAEINVGNRIVRIDAFPMGIDYDQFSQAGDDVTVKREITKIKTRVGERKIIVSIDRLDYTKGIPQRLEAFDYFLDNNPKYREKVTLILVAVPSRTGVDQYALLKKRVDELISRINGKYGTIGWMPIWYLYRFLPFKSLVPLYSVGDVALITPIRDGMNLIAKEYLATKTERKGVLILSEMAGASKALGEALIVNPNDKEEIAGALRQALEMPPHEQVRRNEIMQKRLKRYNVERWAHDFMENLARTKHKQLDMAAKNLGPEMREHLRRDYLASNRRLMLLDYDGTLVSFVDEPARAMPDKEIFRILKKLTADKKNAVVIVSGRDRNTLDKWFNRINLGLIGEHGVWLRKSTGKWEMLKPLRKDWKEQIKPILELFVDRTPGARLEEKDFSLVWHYRKTDQRLGELRAIELKERLLDITTDLNLSVLEGSKVIEVKNEGINKGIAAQKWLDKAKWDFIMTIGDDLTDEDTFEAVPDWAYSIKVRIGYTKARYTLPTSNDARILLRELGNLR